VTDEPVGVIHDIGYQHYEGTRSGRGSLVRSMYVDTARGAYGLGRTGKSKILPMLLLAVMCLPAVITVGVTLVTGIPDLADYAGYAYVMQVIVAIYVAGQAPVAVSRDLRFRTITLYFSRPLRRGDYVAAKFGALTTAVFLFCSAPLVVLLAGAALAREPMAEHLPDFLVALAGAALLSLLLAGLSLAIASVTPRRGLGVAAVIAVLLVLSGVQAVLMALGAGDATGDRNDALATFSGLISPFSLVDGVQAALLGAPSAIGTGPDGQPIGPVGTAEGVVYGVVALALIVASYALLQLRYRKVSVT
jgi:ABC-2 type transport system permease protein